MLRNLKRIDIILTIIALLAGPCVAWSIDRWMDILEKPKATVRR
jgi:hypothetical protein